MMFRQFQYAFIAAAVAFVTALTAKQAGTDKNYSHNVHLFCPHYTASALD
jgi:hypothetical protein